MQVSRSFLETAMGWWELTATKTQVLGVDFLGIELPPGLDAETGEPQEANALLLMLQDRLKAYFQGQRVHFDDLPLASKGTPFQRQVWQQLRQIPYSETTSYKKLAAMVGSPNASRAVGGALANNPWLIVLPCHRVLTHNGKLGGFMGSDYEMGGLTLKSALLRLEGLQMPSLSIVPALL